MKRVADVDRGRCVACGACMKACMRCAITIWRGCYALVDDERCVGCGLCTKACPVGCIAIYKSYMVSQPERTIEFSIDRDGIVHMEGEGA